MTAKKSLRICPEGHKFYKSTDCPSCPTCEAERKPNTGFLALMSAPARRALETEGIETASQLARYTEKEILSLHGMGKASLPVMRSALKRNGLDFKKPD